jgi:preprotein translocase subunit Sss1
MARKNQKSEDSWKQYFSITPYARVMNLAKTPDRDDFVKNALLVTATVIASGIVGFTIFQFMNLIPM